MGRNKTIEIGDIYENLIYVDDKSFERFYYHSKIPTWYFGSRDGEIYSDANNLIMHPSISPKGYKSLLIRLPGEEKAKTIQVHIIIATIYCGGWHKDLVVDHIDGNRLNNNADNLRWVTYSENTWYGYNTQKTHKRYFGDDNHSTHYSDKRVHKACKLLSKGYKYKEVSNITGIPVGYLRDLVTGAKREKISSHYKFPKYLYPVPYNPPSDEQKEEIRRLYNEEHLGPSKIVPMMPNLTQNQIIHAIYDDRYKK